MTLSGEQASYPDFLIPGSYSPALALVTAAGAGSISRRLQRERRHGRRPGTCSAAQRHLSSDAFWRALASEVDPVGRGSAVRI